MWNCDLFQELLAEKIFQPSVSIKTTTLKKHMNTKYNKQKCKICNKEFITSMELIYHVRKNQLMMNLKRIQNQLK